MKLFRRKPRGKILRIDNFGPEGLRYRTHIAWFEKGVWWWRPSNIVERAALDARRMADTPYDLIHHNHARTGEEMKWDWAPMSDEIGAYIAIVRNDQKAKEPPHPEPQVTPGPPRTASQVRLEQDRFSDLVERQTRAVAEKIDRDIMDSVKYQGLIEIAERVGMSEDQIRRLLKVAK